MEYKFRVPCSKSKLGEIREFLHKVLREISIPEMTVNTLVLAVDEVCANLIIHSHNCNADDHIELKVKINGTSEITFEIIDNGVGFNISEYQEPSISDLIRDKRKGGMGLMLVKRIMDEIELIKGEKKNVYRFHKKI